MRLNFLPLIISTVSLIYSILKKNVLFIWSSIFVFLLMLTLLIMQSKNPRRTILMILSVTGIILGVIGIGLLLYKVILEF